MANLTKDQRKMEAGIKTMIYRGYKRGVCDSDGNSVKNTHGKPIAKPRPTSPSATKRMCNRCYELYVVADGHECEQYEK